MTGINFSILFRHLGIIGAADESSYDRAIATAYGPLPSQEECERIWPDALAAYETERAERAGRVGRELAIESAITRGEAVNQQDFQWYVMRQNDPGARTERAIVKHERQSQF